MQVCRHLESQYLDLDEAIRPMLCTTTASKAGLLPPRSCAIA